MNAPEWPLAELIELHRSFIEMRQRRSIEDRRDSSFRLVLCRASMDRLERALIDCPFCPGDLHADTLQEVTLLLVESFSAESLHYTDLGADRFGRWYWTVCCHVCERAARKLLGDALNRLAFVDPETLSQVAAAPEVHEHRFDKLLPAIGQLPEGPIKKAMLDWEAGLTVDESARRRGVSPRTIDRLRERGRQLVLESLNSELAEAD
jgi:hypothetical protein